MAPRGDTPIHVHLVLSGASVSIATVCTHPLDVVKVRLQNDGSQPARKAAFSIRKFVSSFPSIYRSEGAGALTAGMGAAILRAATYGAMRIGLYEPILACAPPKYQKHFITPAVIGFFSGVSATVVGNPLELVKVRLQAESTQWRRSSTAALRDIVRSEGVLALWRGAVPACIRTGLMTATQFFSYKATKTSLVDGCGLADGPGVQAVASLSAALVSTTVTSPVDVVKTRMMTAGNDTAAGILLQTVRDEGAIALFRGWVPNFVRLGPQTFIALFVYERVRALAGLGYL